VVRTQLLPPSNFGEARAIGPRRDVARLRCLDSNVVTEHESKSTVVAALGGAKRLPVLEIRIERESVELRLYGRQGNLSGASRRYRRRGPRTDASRSVIGLIWYVSPPVLPASLLLPHADVEPRQRHGSQLNHVHSLIEHGLLRSRGFWSLRSGTKRCWRAVSTSYRTSQYAGTI